LKVNESFRKIFAGLLAEGVKGIYSLSSQEIGLGIDATVDGVHPNDLGMIRYADAYEKKILFMLNELSGNLPTTIPVVQSRDFYDWRQRHLEIIALNRQEPPPNVVLANSIIHFWGGLPVAELRRHVRQGTVGHLHALLQDEDMGADLLEKMKQMVTQADIDYVVGTV